MLEAPLSSSGNYGRRALLVGVVVFVLAFLLRLDFVLKVLEQWSHLPFDYDLRNETGFLARDSEEYLLPAASLLEGDVVNAGSIDRPPGYPFFLALFGGRAPAILVAQAAVGGVMPVCTALVSHRLTGNLALSTLAGLAAALSPTGIGASGLVLADGLLGALVALGVWLTLLAAREDRNGALLAAGIVFGFGTLVKPILLFWSPVSLALYWLFAGGRPRSITRRTVFLVVVFQLVPALGWSTRNLITDGVFTLSAIGPATTRTYLMARTEARVEAGQRPTNDEIRAKQTEVRQRFGADGRGWPTKVRQYRAEVFQILRTHPLATVATYVEVVASNLSGGWDRFPRQLPESSGAALFVQAARWEGYLRQLAPFAVLAALLATGRVWFSMRTPASADAFRAVAALSLVWIYFVALSGITFVTGPRILYPAQIAIIPSVMVGVSAVAWQVRTRAWSSTAGGS